MIKKLTIYNILPEESKYIGKNILDFLDITYDVMERSKILTVYCPSEVFIQMEWQKNAAKEFLESIGYTEEIRETETDLQTNKYARKHEQQEDIVSSKSILIKRKTPTLCFLLETELS